MLNYLETCIIRTTTDLYSITRQHWQRTEPRYLFSQKAFLKNFVKILRRVQAYKPTGAFPAELYCITQVTLPSTLQCVVDTGRPTLEARSTVMAVINSMQKPLKKNQQIFEEYVSFVHTSNSNSQLRKIGRLEP